MPHELQQAKDTLMALNPFGMGANWPSWDHALSHVHSAPYCPTPGNRSLEAFPMGSGELGPPQLGLAAKLAGGGGGDSYPTCSMSN